MPGLPTWSSASYDAYFKLYKSTGNTTAVFNSTDPSSILRRIIGNFNDLGGTVTHRWYI